MKITLIAVGLVLAIGLGWFLLSPLFIDERVDESFDFVTQDGRLDMQRVMAMAPEERSAVRGEIMSAAAKAPDRQASEAMPEAPSVIASGEFVDADSVHKGSGTANLYALPGGEHVLRFENFRTTNGPDLVVYLAKHPSPARAADVTESGFLSLGKLKGNVGSQNYAVPAGTDISAYNSVVIWCELFGVLFSPAALTRT